MATDRSLAGEVAVVTGALGKLGPTWVAALQDAGAEVVGLDVAAASAGAAFAVEQADVTDRASVEAARDRIRERLGAPTVLVNAAGIDQPPDAAAATWLVEDVTADAFRRTVDVNLTGAFIAMQVFGPEMVAAGAGAIINIGSLYASVAPDPRFYDHLDLDPPFLKPPAYAASKAGLLALTRYFARLWGPAGVRVNALSPGGVAGGQDTVFRRKYESRVPLGRMADLGDLGGPLVFLASDAAAYITGHELRVDGGFTA